MQWLPCSTLPAQLANQQQALPARRTHKRRTLQQRHRRSLRGAGKYIHNSRITTPSPGHTLLGITASLFSEPSPTPQGEKSLSHHHPDENPLLLIFTLLRKPTIARAELSCRRLSFFLFLFFSFRLEPDIRLSRATPRRNICKTA